VPFKVFGVNPAGDFPSRRCAALPGKRVEKRSLADATQYLRNPQQQRYARRFRKGGAKRRRDTCSELSVPFLRGRIALRSCPLRGVLALFGVGSR